MAGTGQRWVNLGRACELLGVNQSTVRRWADSGKIRCFRTPGGHRRLAEADLIAMTRGGGGGYRRPSWRSGRLSAE